MIQYVKVQTENNSFEYRGHLAGIVSRAYGCAWFNSPGLNVRVNYYLDWIDEHMESEDKCEYI